MVADFRKAILDAMSRHKLPGCAAALVDRTNIIWSEGFGRTTAKGRIPVTPDTPFFLGGISKLLSASAVMIAVQEGRVGLDRPVHDYLPDFKVYSRYERNPERGITLRRLLNQTAGLPVEAPLGNYFEPVSETSFEEHVKSLYGNWLVYPVGQAFQAGNAPADLAAYLVQVSTSERFEDYIMNRLFSPLGMEHSLVDRQQVLATKDRAFGHMMGIAKMPSTLPCLGAASMYASASDLGRFIQFQMNEGRVGERQILEPAQVRFLQTPAGIVEPGKRYYGAGLYVDKLANGRMLLWSDGWGFGSCGYMHWYPEYGIGAVLLSNRLPNPSLNELCLSFTQRLISEGVVKKTAPAPEINTNTCVGIWWGWDEHKPTPYRQEWKKYCGMYRLRFNAYELEWWAKLAVLIKGRDEFTPQIAVRQHEGYLCVTESSFFDLIGVGRHVEEKLQLVAPGLFATKSGIVLDLAQDGPRWRNYRMEKR